MTRTTLVLTILLCSSVPALAQEEPQAKQEVTPLTRLSDATLSMTKGLTENQDLQFQAIEASYRTIRAVEDVQTSVTRAVESCGQKNPDIKQEMDKRLREWKNALRPVMKEANNKLDKMVLLQDFTTPSHVRAYLKMFDEAILFRNQGIRAVPVTEKEDCLELKSSMDKTQDTLVKLLKESLKLDSPLKAPE